MAVKNEVKPRPSPAAIVSTSPTPEAMNALANAGPAALTEKQKKELAARAQEDAIEAAAKQFAVKLDAAMAAKPEDFEEGESDFWRPSATDKVLQGIFVGTATPGRYKQHAILTKGKDGRPLPVRMLG